MFGIAGRSPGRTSSSGPTNSPSQTTRSPIIDGTQTKTLQRYSACDVSDALVKLGVKNGGFIPEMGLLSERAVSLADSKDRTKVIAPAWTVLMVSKSSRPDWVDQIPSNIPETVHFADLTQYGRVAVIQAPFSYAAAVGGLIGARMQVRRVAGVVVSGRVRDLDELNGLKIPVRFLPAGTTSSIWAIGSSTVGSGADMYPHAVNVAVRACGVWVHPGDLMFCDPLEGVVVIPSDKLQEVLDLLSKLKQQEEQVKQHIAGGGTMSEAIKRYRKI